MQERSAEYIAKKLNITLEQALEVLESDKAIDRGADLFPLSNEQKQVEKEMRKADKKPTVYQFSKRTKKVNQGKADLITDIAEHLAPNVQNLEVVNNERELQFMVNGVKYKLVLSCPRG